MPGFAERHSVDAGAVLTAGNDQPRPIASIHPRPAAGDIRAILRSATAALHQQIDGLFGGFDLAQRDGLTRFLVAQAIGTRACQPRITRFARQSLGCDATDHWKILRRDLAALNIDTGRLPRLALPDDGHGRWADAGVFYVIAGSRMGAAVLRQRATAPFPGGPAHAICGYFAAGEGPAMWRLFRQWLGSRAAADDPADADQTEMIAAATATFQLFAEAAQWVAAQPAMPTLGVTA